MVSKVDAVEANVNALDAQFQELKLSVAELQKMVVQEGKARLAETQANEEFHSLMTACVRRQPGKGPSNEEEYSSGPSFINEEVLDESRMEVKKVELPSFDGSDPRAWLVWAETYFRV